VAGRLAPGFEPRRLANLAWTTARHALAQLRDEACLLLRRAGPA
jgi:TetR/AcrR family transcriptional regulator